MQEDRALKISQMQKAEVTSGLGTTDVVSLTTTWCSRGTWPRETTWYGGEETKVRECQPARKADLTEFFKAEPQFQPCLIAACRLSLVASSIAGFA